MKLRLIWQELLAQRRAALRLARRAGIRHSEHRDRAGEDERGPERGEEVGRLREESDVDQVDPRELGELQEAALLGRLAVGAVRVPPA